MPKIAYKPMKMTPIKKRIITQANEIIAEYHRIGLDLTLRQLYYVFVSREWFPEDWADATTGSKNNERSYDKLGVIIGDARMAGLIDWSAITDRTRNLRKRAEWNTPADLVGVCADQFRIDRWKNQAVRPEVWIEKDALIGVIERPCEDNGVAYFSCRGYTSMSEIWVAAQRIVKNIQAGQKVKIFHFGDHDPSGVDMTRDIWERLSQIVMRDLARLRWLTKETAKAMDERIDAGESAEDVYPFCVQRVALNMDQIEQYNPPPNPAKLTDARAKKYVQKYGNESWELDALDPRVIVELVENHIGSCRDPKLWEVSGTDEDVGRNTFAAIRDRFGDVAQFLSE